MQNHNKESLKLLGMSLSGSDSGSDLPELVVAPPKKKRVKRRLRGGTASARIQQAPLCYCSTRSVALSFAVTVLVCWLITLTWLAIVLHGELARLDANIRQAVAGSQGVPDALQKCHSLSRELQQNQTALYNNLASLTLQIGNFSTQLSNVQYRLRAIEEQLKDAPELVSVPKAMEGLSNSVASFGSEIRDLGASVTTIKEQNSHLEDTTKNLVQNVTTIKKTISQLLNSTQQAQAPSKESSSEKENIINIIQQVAANVSTFNDTLSKKLQWALEDQSSHRKLIESLQEGSQNLSAQLTTLENKAASQAILLSSIPTLADKVNSTEFRLDDIDHRVRLLQTQSEQLESETTQMNAAITKLEGAMTSLVPHPGQVTAGDSENTQLQPKNSSDPSP